MTITKGLVMADDSSTDSTTAIVDASNETEARKNQKQPRQPTKSTAGEQSASKPVEARTAASSGKRHSHGERIEKLDLIQSKVAAGHTLKDAVASAGISEQTYYNWKRNTDIAGHAHGKPSLGGEQTDLLALETENQRLRHLLAEKLRVENLELREKLNRN
ncbi:hypothetical protein N185_16390 [Sinorhizobium sp. GW3]|nr:hypothetical protein N185_16390 [Sinorhizobium sp. GW3]